MSKPAGRSCPLCERRITGNHAMHSHLMGHARRGEIKTPEPIRDYHLGWLRPRITLWQLEHEAFAARSKAAGEATE